MRSGFVVALVVALLASPAAASPAQESPTSYVALGDSFTAGPGIPTTTGTPGCLQSDSNYPHLVAPLGQQELRDASCSGATTADMFRPQTVVGGTHPAQLDSVDTGSRVVTLSIGGNDIGYAEILQRCAALLPLGKPCQAQFNKDGNDVIAKRISETAPKVANVLDAVTDRAPDAKVFVIGYPAILPDSGNGCWPWLPIAPDDVPYLRFKHYQLNAMLAKQASLHGATYVDAYTPSIGKDACQPADVRWVEPLLPANPAAPFHPNARGMRGVADTLLAAT